MSGTTFLRGENPLRADKLNTAFSERVWRRGDTMQGMLTLWHDPINPFDAATKQYVDSRLGVLPPGSLDGGGTLNGPLYFTATGGNTMRSAQDRASETANPLDHGADPTGATDSSVAFNRAASLISTKTGKRVSLSLSPGTYRINKQVVLRDGQSLLGSGPGDVILYISDQLDHTATSIILCAAGVVDPGPTISNVLFWFEQPYDVASRATFKTLAAGGTSAAGGTGVQYPWAIDTEGNSGRIIIRNVNIDSAWDGINANKACFWIDGLRIGAFNRNISIGGPASACVADWAHLSDIEFWTFGMNAPNIQNVFMDGQTIAMEIGAQNGLTAQNISCFTSRLVFTSEAYAGWFTFSNLAMDAGQATIEVGAAGWLQIANLYTTSGTNAVRPLIDASSGAKVMINNWYGHNSSPHPMLSVHNNADVTLVGGMLIPYDMTTDTIQVSQNGSLRVSNVKLFMTGTVPWTPRPVFVQYDTSSLQVDNIDMIGTAPSGLAVLFNADQPGNYCGNISLLSGWTRAQGAFGPKGRYGDVSRDGTSIQVGSTGFARLSTSGHHSTAFGNLALDQHQDSATDNTAMGWLAGYGVSTGLLNTFMGSATGYGATDVITGSNNTAYGANAARNLTSGNQNVFLGSFTGQSITTGASNIFIGFGIDAPAATTNAINIGNTITMTIGGPTIQARAGAATGTQPKGSLWMRSDGASGSTLYVSQGGGVWNAVAGV